MKIHISIDLGSIFIGVIAGLAMAPYFYDSKSLKKTAKIGAAKEIVKETKKNLFRREK